MPKQRSSRSYEMICTSGTVDCIKHPGRAGHLACLQVLVDIIESLFMYCCSVGFGGFFHQCLGFGVAGGVLHGPLDNSLGIFLTRQVNSLPRPIDAGLSPDAIGQLVLIEGKSLGSQENQWKIRLGSYHRTFRKFPFVIFMDHDKTSAFLGRYFRIDPEMLHISNQKA